MLILLRPYKWFDKKRSSGDDYATDGANALKIDHSQDLTTKEVQTTRPTLKLVPKPKLIDIQPVMLSSIDTSIACELNRHYQSEIFAIEAHSDSMVIPIAKEVDAQYLAEITSVYKAYRNFTKTTIKG